MNAESNAARIEADLAQVRADEAQLERDENRLERDVQGLEHEQVQIVVNATPHQVLRGSITFRAVVTLAYPTPPGPDPEYTVSYRRGRPDHPKGSLLEGHSVEVREGMIFVVTATDKS